MKGLARIGLAFLLWLSLGCQSTYSPKDQFRDKLEVLATKGNTLSPAQKDYILKTSFSSRSEIEAKVEEFLEENRRGVASPSSPSSPFSSQENFPKMRVYTPRFFHGRSLLQQEPLKQRGE